jgi:hypothetical protein
VSNGGSLNITGTANGSGVGVYEAGRLNVSDGNVAINGIADAGTGVNLAAAMNVTLNTGNSMDIVGSSASNSGSGYGVCISGSTNDITISGGRLNITGTANGTGSGQGVYMSVGNVTVSNSGGLNIIGTANGMGSSDGVYMLGGNVAVINGGSLDITGTANGTGSGDGVDMFGGSITVSNGGSLNITGTASGTGVGVYEVGMLSVSDSNVNINGTSDLRYGVLLDAIVAVESSELNITGTSNGDYGVYNENGSGGSLNVVAGATAYIVGDSNAAGQSGVYRGTIRVAPGGTVCVVDNGIEDCAETGVVVTGGGDGGGGGSAALELAVIGGGVAFFLSSRPDLSLAAPDALTLSGGDAVFWADAKLSTVVVDLKGGTAEAQLFTRSGYLKRQLKFSDSADGVNHYAYQNAADKTQAKLSVNPQTCEYFYSEIGMQSGKSYTVNAHGWLKSSQPMSQRAVR